MRLQREGGLDVSAAATDTAMLRALDLAWTVLGRTSPNPPVGAVVVDTDGRIVGEGATQPPGGAHAEIVALRTAGDRARGATLVSTLEPCSHTGRTGPCTTALISADVARLVYAVSDPTPEAGGGGRVLQAAGIEIRRAYADEAAAGALRQWLFAVSTGRPFVTWKYAATLDGRVAAADGSSRWITGEQARADGHRLRGQSDAVVVGSGTVLADDPQLTARGGHADHQPLRVVLDRRGRTPVNARVHDDAAATLVLDSADPAHALKELYGRGVRSVLLEGGPTLAGAFVEAGLIDRVVGYLAPALLGDGPAALESAGMPTIADALRLSVEDVTRVGEDVRITAVPRRD